MKPGSAASKLLAEIFRLLETEGWRYSTDTGWKDWDVQIYGNFWWIVRCRRSPNIMAGRNA